MVPLLFKKHMQSISVYFFSFKKSIEKASVNYMNSHFFYNILEDHLCHHPSQSQLKTWINKMLKTMHWSTAQLKATMAKNVQPIKKYFTTIIHVHQLHSTRKVWKQNKSRKISTNYYQTYLHIIFSHNMFSYKIINLLLQTRCLLKLFNQ